MHVAVSSTVRMRRLRTSEQRVVQVREVGHICHDRSLSWCSREWVEGRRRVRPDHLGDDMERRVRDIDQRDDVPLEQTLGLPGLFDEGKVSRAVVLDVEEGVWSVVIADENGMWNGRRKCGDRHADQLIIVREARKMRMVGD